jgi:hypothetical protein
MATHLHSELIPEFQPIPPSEDLGRGQKKLKKKLVRRSARD